MSLAILCSGQGRQHADMFALTGDAPEAANLFQHAAILLGGRDPREVVRTDPLSALHRDRVGQILCTLQALAAAVALDGLRTGPVVIAGYSVGELAAWGVIGVFSATETLDLAAFRAKAMDTVSQPGDGLLSVRGLSRKAVDGLCQRHAAAVAIVNPANAYIIGGTGSVLDAVAIDARALNAARVTPLAVEVASHTPGLVKASGLFREKLRSLAPSPECPASMRLLSGIDGTPVMDLNGGLDKLAAQISQTVRWADCLQACIEGGAQAFLELGPGRALSGMASAAYSDVPARSLDDFRTLRGVQEWIARHVDGGGSR